MGRYNKTRLNPDNEQRIHRDYLAHCLRWDFVVHHYLNRLRDNTLKIIDVGCGEAPLMRVLHANMCRPAIYVGVDVDPKAIGAASDRSQPRNFDTRYFNADLTSAVHADHIVKECGQFDLAVCFEVLEHVPTVGDAQNMLINIHQMLADDGELLVSTPTRFNEADPVTCKNHLFEFTQVEFENAVRAANFKVIDKFGTMMYMKMLNKAMPSDHVYMIQRLQQYYDSNVLSAFLAPLFPNFSRSQMIVARKK